jgi:predicted transcriptional regulator
MKKQKIIDFVLETVLKEGTIGIKIEKIASGLNVSERTIRKIFPTEEELLREVMEAYLHLILETK